METNINYDLYFEKKAAKKTANKIGASLIFLVVFAGAINSIFNIITEFFPVIKSFLNDEVFNIIFNDIKTVPAFLLAGIILIKSEHRKLKEHLLFAKPKEKSFLPAILMGLGFCMMANVFTSLFSNIFSEIFFEAKAINETLPQNLLGILIYVISTTALPALLEEFFFRGAIFGAVLKFGKPTAILVSAVCFSLIHGNLVQIPFAFLVGLYLGFITAETESIWPAIIVHFCNNLIAVILSYITLFLGENVTNLIYLPIVIVLIFIGLAATLVYSARFKNMGEFKKTPHKSGTKKLVTHIIFAPLMIVFMCLMAFTVISVQLLG